MKFHFLVLFTILALLSSGCTTVTSHRFEAVPSKIRRGATSKTQVIEILGEPDHKRFDPSGETWNYGDGGQQSSEEVVVGQAIGIGAGFIPVPYVGTAISGVRSLGRSAQTSQPSATIKFDTSGTVRDYVVDIP